MEWKETEDEKWDTSKYLFKNNARSGCNVRRWVLKRGLCLGRKILVASFVASAAPVVVPPLVVASSIGVYVSMPYAIFLASHVCTQYLMSKLLPRPTPLVPQFRVEMCFQPGCDVMHTYKEEQALEDETKRHIEMDGVQYMKNGENMTWGSERGPQEEDATDGMEEHSKRETDSGVQVQLTSGDNGAVKMVEEFKTPFDVTTVVLEDEAMEDDIEEAELQRETKGLLEKIRDEGKADITKDRGEYAEGICGRENESDQKIDPVVEDMEVAWVDTLGGTGEDLGKEEVLNVCEEMLHSRNDEDKETMLEGKEFDNTNDSQTIMAGSSELLIPAEPIEDMREKTLVFNISMGEDLSEVMSEKTGIHIAAIELKPQPDYQNLLDNCILNFENQESHVRELNERMYYSDAEAREIANESAPDLLGGKQIDPDEYAYTIDLHGESSNADEHTDSMEVLVSPVEQESMPSECCSGENIVYPSFEAVMKEENIWEQLDVIRKIVGYEGAKQGTCANELKALYIFTGVEPPTSLDKNSTNHAEIKEKLYFLMSIVGIKSNMA